MKHKFLALAFVLLLAIPAFAQGNDTIILDDSTPSINVMISLPPDTTGTIHLDLAQAAVSLTDEVGNIVFYTADARVHGLELNISPNSGFHTLSVERLPNVATASVNVSSLDNLTINGSVLQMDGESIGLNQAVNVSFNPAQPGKSISVSIPEQTQGVITAAFPDIHATTQVVDANGSVVIATFGGHVDGYNAVLDGGNYDLTILSDGSDAGHVAGVRVVSADEAGFPVIEVPVADIAVVDNAPSCNARIGVSSVNFRSGPGTGYSVIDYGYFEEQYPVGGRNQADNWILIATDTGSAWVSASTLNFSTGCEDLTVFDTPFKDAPVAPIIVEQAPALPNVVVQPQQPSIVYVNESQNTSNNNNNNKEHDDDDKHEREHEDDD